MVPYQICLRFLILERNSWDYFFLSKKQTEESKKQTEENKKPKRLFNGSRHALKK